MMVVMWWDNDESYSEANDGDDDVGCDHVLQVANLGLL